MTLYIQKDADAINTEMAALIALTEQCATLIRERDALQRTVWNYEKFGVTCQTYSDPLKLITCSECNTGK